MVTNDHNEARAAGAAHREILSRWTPDILALQTDAYICGYLDGLKAERTRAAASGQQHLPEATK